MDIFEIKFEFCLKDLSFSHYKIGELFSLFTMFFFIYIQTTSNKERFSLLLISNPLIDLVLKH